MANVQDQIAQARAAGYSDADIAKHLSDLPDYATKIKLAESAGFKPEEIIGHLAAPAAPPVPFGEQLNAAIKDVPRQIGLTARYGMEGLGNTVGVLSDPIRGAINIATGSHLKPAGELASNVADAIGLPKPANATERIVGDATRLMAGAGGISGVAGKAAANVASPVAKTVLNSLAANPGAQVASGGASGLAGGYTRETGGNGLAQGVASLAAGVAAPAAINSVGAGVNAVRNSLAPAVVAPAVNPQIDITITNALKQNGMDFGKLPQAIQNSIRGDVSKAMSTEGQVSPDAVRRLADYRLVGATPTAATLSLDPAAVSQQKNLAKLGINSKDVAAQQLGQTENANNRTLISGLNDAGAAAAPGSFNAGQGLLDHLGGYASAQKAKIGALYDAARDSSGRSAPLDPSHFSQAVGDNLDKANINAFLPAEIRGMVNDFATGKVPLNIKTAEQFKTIVGNAQRSSSDGNARTALGIVRSALDDAPLLMGQAPAAVVGGSQLKTPGGLSTEVRPNIGQESIDAFNAARSANRQFMGQVEKTPALADAIDDAHPDKFFQKHVLNANVGDLQQTLAVTGAAAKPVLKAQIVSYLKTKALNNANDETGNFSQSAYKSALDSLGDKKLGLLFTPDEINQLKAIGRVASYEQFQPRGSAVNNSNTAAAGLSSILDRIADSPLLSKIPFGKQLAEPIQNISVGMKSKAALNVPRALVTNGLGPARSPTALLLSPAALMGGNNQDDDQRNSLAAGR